MNPEPSAAPRKSVRTRMAEIVVIVIASLIFGGCVYAIFAYPPIL